jgi:hypothetical protein
MNKESYSQRQQILMRRLIALHTKPVYLALQHQMNAAAASVRANGIEKTIGQTFPLNTEIQAALVNLYSDAAFRAKKNFMYVKRFGGGNSFVNKVLEYLKRYLLNKAIAPISTTTVRVIDRILSEAIAKGWGVEKTAKQLESTDISKSRARLIIRTESVRATNLTQMMAADDEVYQMEKTWIAIEDKRTRVTHSHKGVDGQTQDLDQPFTNGLKFPGDPDAPIEEVANCRCTMGYKVKRDTNGRPVKKIFQANG